jgi:hypothetical protein
MLQTMINVDSKSRPGTLPGCDLFIIVFGLLSNCWDVLSPAVTVKLVVKLVVLHDTKR